MATRGSIPVWLLDSKESIIQSQEWSNCVQELYDAVEQQLKESHVPSFSDLREAERVMFIERARQAIHGGLAYSKLYEHVSTVLDRDLNKAVSRHQFEDLPSDTKTDLILEAVLDGSVGLLKKWPDLRSRLHVFLNQQLPEQLRPVAWRLYLEDVKLRRKYLQTLATDPRSAVSAYDREISRVCEDLLKSDPYLDEFQGSTGVFYALRAVLSYYHSVHGGADPLPQPYYKLLFPFIIVASSSLPRREPAPSHVVACLTEEYFTFTSSLPHFIHNSITEVSDPAINIFAGRVARHLNMISPEVGLSISTTPFPPVEDQNDSEHQVDSENLNKTKETGNRTVPADTVQTNKTKETGNRTVLADTVQTVVTPIIQNMFVGYVRKEVLLYIWDQYIIGLDSSGFTDDYLPAVTTVFLKLVGDRLRAAKFSQLSNFSQSVVREGMKLTVPQFQYEMNKHFHVELFSQLKQDTRAAVPVLDPTQAVNYRWMKWFNDHIPPHKTADDRRNEREKKNGVEHMKSAGVQYEWAEDQNLVDKLEQERKRREDGERIAAEEISRLRRELDELKKQKQRKPSVASTVSTYSKILVAPPPSAASLEVIQPVDVPQIPPTPPRDDTSDKETLLALTDLLRRVASGFNRVAHGEGYQSEQLNKKTRKALAFHREDLKNAETSR